MFVLFLIKPPTATGQSHSSAKIACPAIGTRTDKFAEVQALLEVRESGAARSRSIAVPPGRLVLGRDSLTVRRVNCGAVDGRRSLRACATARSAAGRRVYRRSRIYQFGIGDVRRLRLGSFPGRS